jgi:hypothetical protein
MLINFEEQNVPISMTIGSDYSKLLPELKPVLIGWVKRAIRDGLRQPGDSICYESQSWETDYTIEDTPLWVFIAAWLFRTKPRHADVICYTGSVAYVRAGEAKIRGKMKEIPQIEPDHNGKNPSSANL